jgi:hypothetical protein
MRFYTETHHHYCGIDLHARNMYVCILDREGLVVLGPRSYALPPICAALRHAHHRPSYKPSGRTGSTRPWQPAPQTSPRHGCASEISLEPIS